MKLSEDQKLSEAIYTMMKRADELVNNPPHWYPSECLRLAHEIWKAFPYPGPYVFLSLEDYIAAAESEIKGIDHEVCRIMVEATRHVHSWMKSGGEEPIWVKYYNMLHNDY